MNFDCPLECGASIKSFYRHIQRCSKKDLFGKVYLKCKYDYNHIVKKEIYESHLENCDKKCIDSDTDEVDLLKIFDKKKKLLANQTNEEVYSDFKFEKNEEETVNFVDKEKSNLMFKSEIDVDKDSLDFYNFVYKEK